VEVSPAYDHAEITAIAAATVIFDIIALLARRVLYGCSEHQHPVESAARRRRGVHRHVRQRDGDVSQVPGRSGNQWMSLATA
jgi:hypothetical protein